MYKVRLTVTESRCRGGCHKAGDTFVVGDLCPPLCHELWNQLYPMLYALHTVYRLVPQNNGFGFAPVTVTYEEKFDYTPIFCSMDHHVSSREIGLLYRDSSSLSPAARQFIQTAREVIPSFVKSEIPHFEVREDINFS